MSPPILATRRSPDETVYVLGSGWDALTMWWRHRPHAWLARGPVVYLVGPVDTTLVEVDDLHDPRMLLTGPAEWVYAGRTWEVTVPSSVSRLRDTPMWREAGRSVQIVREVTGGQAATPQGGHARA